MTKYLNIALLFFLMAFIFLFFTHGHRNFIFIPLFLSMIFIPLWNVNLNVKTDLLALFVILTIYIIFQFEGNGIREIQIYATNKHYLKYRNLFQLISISSVVIFYFCKTKKALIISSCFAVLSIIISFSYGIMASPRPIIDLWNIHEATANAVLSLKNPYLAEIQNPYPLYLQKKITPFGIHAFYLPVIYYILAPFKLFFGDTRFAGLFFTLLTSIVGLLKLRAAKNDIKCSFLLAFLFLFMPYNYFLLEQGWSDPIVIGMIAIAYLVIEKFGIFSSIIIGLGLLTKQYAIPIFLYINFTSSHSLKRKIGHLLISAFIAISILLIFTILDWRSFWGSLHGVLLPSTPNSFNMSSWLLSLTENTYQFLRYIILLVLVVSFIIYKKVVLSNSSIFLILFYFLGLFFIAPNAYFNYYWFAIGLFFIFLNHSTQKAYPSISIMMFNDMLYIFTRSAMLFVFFKPHISDLMVYNSYVENFLATLKISSFEYPPLAMFFMLIPKLLANVDAKSILDYRIFFVIMNLLFDFVLYKNIRKTISNSWITSLYLLQSLLLYNLIYDRIDFIFSFFIYYFCHYFVNMNNKNISRPFKSYLILALGILLKIIPIFFIPFIFALKSEFVSNYKNIKKILYAVLPVTVLVLFFFYENLLFLFKYHFHRGIQIESLWNLVLKLMEGINIYQIKIINNYGSFNFAGYSSWIAILSNYLWLLLLAIFWFYTVRNIGIIRQSKKLCYELFLIVLLLIITSFKVFSPQFIIWLIPLLFVYFDYDVSKLKRIKILLWFSIVLLTQLYWRNYFDLFKNKGLWNVLYVRNCFFLIFTLFIYYDFRKIVKLNRHLSIQSSVKRESK